MTASWEAWQAFIYGPSVHRDYLPELQELQKLEYELVILAFLLARVHFRGMCMMCRLRESGDYLETCGARIRELP
jgi:hypothetical protein